MGKKAKLGKARKDRFYQLAKETGYRSRAAFKLIQLNRKFEFLQKSRVVVDLCAAPGGWLQVAAENTPVSSLVIGVDLVPIRTIPKTICLQNDITTENCRQAIKKELQTWQADAVLNDGAPNVGKSWVHDAFQQAQLTLSALKLATGILRKGGWFVTKIFRSKDYNSLLWVFHQLFKKVHATKPQASRNESAEIFVVCENYLAPDKLDSKFLDPKYVFKEVEEEVQISINAFKPELKQRNRQGYPEGVTSLHFVKNVSEFMNNDNYLQILASSSVLKFDDEAIANHSLTTDEIKSCCQDIRVLGKKDIKRLIAWRKQIRKEKEDEDKKEETEAVVETDEEDEELKLEEMLATAKEEEKKQLKKRLKKIREKKLKLTHRMDLKMDHPDDVIEQVDDIALFDLNKINTKKALDEVQKGDLSLMDLEDIVQDDDIYIPKERLKKTIHKDTTNYDYYIDSDNENPQDDDNDDISMAEMSGDDDNDNQDEFDINEPAEEENPLLVPLDNKKTVSQRVDDWFSKDSFAGLVSKDSDDNDDSSSEVEEIHKAKVDKENVNKMNQQPQKSKTKPGKQSEADANGKDDDLEEESDGDYYDEDDDDLDKEILTKKVQKRTAPELDAEGMALGARMVKSKKQKREIFESGYNRYMSDDTNLPRWFIKEEEKFYKKNTPVTKAEVEEYKEMMKAVDARPIKKVAEAKARKKMRSMKKLEKVRKKAEGITDAVDTSEREKWMKIKDIYKKAGLLGKKKKEVAYVVAKRGGGTRGSKPKGPFKVVDKRLKKDKRSVKANVKRKEKSKKKR